MDIKQAKQQIKYTMQAYFAKDEFGGYALPPQRQRPVFLLGAPGIGKTAIVEQIAQELDVGFVAYSMTSCKSSTAAKRTTYPSTP